MAPQHVISQSSLKGQRVISGIGELAAHCEAKASENAGNNRTAGLKEH